MSDPKTHPPVPYTLYPVPYPLRKLPNTSEQIVLVPAVLRERDA
jgi:hypothetical protein